jgi:probable HAF family extracellular repeat protein
MACPYFLRPLTEALLGFALSLFGLSLGVVPDAQAAMSYSFTILDVPGATYTEARSINASGQVTGYYSSSDYRSHGFVYSNGTFTTLDVPEARGTNAASINASGQVAGYYYDATSVHGFIATPTVTDIPTLSQWALLLGGGLLIGMALLAQVRRTRPLRG